MRDVNHQNKERHMKLIRKRESRMKATSNSRLFIMQPAAKKLPDSTSTGNNSIDRKEDEDDGKLQSTSAYFSSKFTSNKTSYKRINMIHMNLPESQNLKMSKLKHKGARDEMLKWMEKSSERSWEIIADSERRLNALLLYQRNPKKSGRETYLI